MPKKLRKLLVVIGGAALTFVTLTVIPAVVNTVSRKADSAQGDAPDASSSDLGPETAGEDQDAQDEE